MKYFKTLFDMTGETLAMVKMQEGKSLRVDSSSITAMKCYTEQDWIDLNYIETTAEEFDAFYSTTLKGFDNILNPSHEAAV